MEKIIQQNKDEITMKYMVVTIFSSMTLRKLEKVEKLRKELKTRHQQEKDFNKL
ncbi:hypothetical protein [Radiobacillus sp. PE A8.2]|uniref:hypothetical protein n=1 Tax=Radiobacillus sp. PE A8.2 TaxID=3380349 RepID=UPI0038908073